MRRTLALVLVAACGGGSTAQDASSDAATGAFPGCAPASGEATPVCLPTHFCWVSPSPVGRGIHSVSGGGCDYWLVGDAVYRMNGTTITGVDAHGGTNAVQVFPTEVWAAGDTTRRFDGKTWTTVDNRASSYVWGVSPDDVWVVRNLDIAHRNLDIAHWDGQTMTRARPLASEAFALEGTASDDVRVIDGATIVHWNGAFWANEPLDGQPLALWGAARDDWYAVGNDVEGGGVIWHYDGASWSRVHTEPGALHAVWGTAGNDVWAGGEGDHVVHFDGASWAPVPLASTETVLAIHGTDREDVVFAGNELLARWDGTQIAALAGQIHVEPGEAWAAMYGASPTDVWAAGDHGTIAHLFGTTWSTSRIAAEPLEARAMTGAGGEVWVGGGEAGSTRVWHRRDATWDATDLATGGVLRAMFAASATDVWAAGDAGAIFHFDGTSWRWTPGPTAQQLLGIWGNASDAWAVGGFTVLHWNGSAWAKLSVFGGGPYTAVWGRSSNEVYIGGNSGALMVFSGYQFTLRSVANGPIHALGGTASVLWAASDGAVMLDRGTGPYLLGTQAESWFGAYFPSRDDGWIAGSGGVIMRYQP